MKADGNGCLTKVKEIKSGYYWWVPQCFVNEGKLEKEYWSIVLVDDKNSLSIDKVGLFVGPLVPPSLMIR
jgi:hypothetical protein